MPYSFKWTGLLVLSLCLAQAAAFADPLSDSEKAAKREELNKYFATALAATQPGELGPAKAKNILRYTANGSVRFGYDNNVNLDKSKDGDGFHAEHVNGLVEYDPTGLELFGQQVTLGGLARYHYLGYFDRDEMSYQNGIVSPFVRLRLHPKLSFKAAYEFRALNYDKQESLNYISHAGNFSLTHQITTGLSQKASFKFEHLQYSDRKELLPSSAFGNGDREDTRFETTYGIRDRIGRLLVNVDGVWTRNDSNDLYFDYNDYNDLGLDGSASVRIADHWILTGLGGWHHRDYDNRVISLTSTSTQKDNWYFAGGRIYYAINAWSGVDLSYTWQTNNSNEPNHEYSASLTSAGYHLYF